MAEEMGDRWRMLDVRFWSAAAERSVDAALEAGCETKPTDFHRIRIKDETPKSFASPRLCGSSLQFVGGG
jgi:hypothetical protein